MRSIRGLALAFGKRSGLSAIPARSKYTLPDLPYDYGALEPVISAEIMQLHHQKHHQTYVNNLNAALEKFDDAKAKNDLSGEVALQKQIKFNGGGNINHSIFWRNLCPPKQAKGKPSGDLLKEIEAQFKSFENFKGFFNTQTGAIQGSGWGWLGYNMTTGSLQFATTKNQNPLLATRGLVPLLGVDIWEHAYYLQYKNQRPEYLKAIWSIINWDDVEQRHKDAKAGRSTEA